jgi:hypothetical protein
MKQHRGLHFEVREKVLPNGRSNYTLWYGGTRAGYGSFSSEQGAFNHARFLISKGKFLPRK